MRSEDFFVAARPVWPDGLETTMNAAVTFEGTFVAAPGENVVLKITGATHYKVSLNGEFLFHGPARAGRGVFRVDAFDLSQRVVSGKNALTIEVRGCYVRCYEYFRQESFLQAEIVAEKRVVLATGGDGFSARPTPGAIRKIERFSAQRTFSEARRLTRETAPSPTLKLRAFPNKSDYAPRGVPFPLFALHPARRLIATGTVAATPIATIPTLNFIVKVGDVYDGYPREALELSVLDKATARDIRDLKTVDEPFQPFRLEAETFALWDLGLIKSGFIGVELETTTPGEIILSYDEKLVNGDIKIGRNNCLNAVVLDIAPGRYVFETADPRCFRYLKILVGSGTFVVHRLFCREYENPDAERATFSCDDPALNAVFDAARESFRQNCVDIFMDCPGRERAGWTGDALFSSAAAKLFTGDLAIETNMFENYLTAENEPNLPPGMIPMCYPSNHANGRFIPPFALYFVRQLQEYAKRGGGPALIERYRRRIIALFDYFARFRNADGLLENLESWLFLEWSNAANFVQNVSYPINMAYADALDRAGELFDVQSWRDDAERVRKKIRERSFDGTFFVDNAVRENERLVETTNRSELCQYMAFYFGTARNDGPFRDLSRCLSDSFDGASKINPKYPDIVPKNILFGSLFRLDCLSAWGRADKVAEDIKTTFGPMAKESGTLWEMANGECSRNHGCVSYVAVAIVRDLLGVKSIDPPAKTIEVEFRRTPLTRCEGKIPLGNGTELVLAWERQGDRVRYRLTAPPEFKTSVAAADALVIA